MDISVIIITKNETSDIKRCLDSVHGLGEIIVVDSGSVDDTVEICKRYTAKVFYNKWPGFGKQKNYALDLATKSWVLSLDADEWLTPTLREEIIAVVSANKDLSYNIPRKSYYCGKLIRFGHWRNDKVMRLFKRDSGEFSNDIVHEKLLVTNAVEKLSNHILHNSFTSHEDVLNKMDLYSSLLAKQKFDAGKTSSLPAAIIKSLWAFINSYILKLGLLDGQEGFMVAFSFAEGTYYKYIKLSLLHNRNNIEILP